MTAATLVPHDELVKTFTDVYSRIEDYLSRIDDYIMDGKFDELAEKTEWAHEVGELVVEFTNLVRRFGEGTEYEDEFNSMARNVPFFAPKVEYPDENDIDDLRNFMIDIENIYHTVLNRVEEIWGD